MATQLDLPYPYANAACNCSSRPAFTSWKCRRVTHHSARPRLLSPCVGTGKRPRSPGTIFEASNQRARRVRPPRGRFSYRAAYFAGRVGVQSGA